MRQVRARVDDWLAAPAARWWGPLAIAVLAGYLRLRDLAHPHAFVFDETYYAKDALSLAEYGYARSPIDDANEQILSGQATDIFTDVPSQIVHPEAGKWLIALGIDVFGMTPFGWRIAAAVVGALTVFVLARLVATMTQSAVFGTFAGLLLAVDGLHFTMSRMAMLDIFVAFWLVLAVSCLVADHRYLAMVSINRPIGRHSTTVDARRTWLRPWQVLAGLCFGLAIATKWNALWPLAAFGLAFVLVEVARRSDVVGRWPVRVLKVGFPAFLRIVGVAFVTYVLTWSGWLAHSDEYEARFGTADTWGAYVDGDGSVPLQSLVSLWNYHKYQMYDFHTGDYISEQEHPYASHPVGWLVQYRPVSAYAETDVAPAACGAAADSSCTAHLTLLGNPAIWWAGLLAITVCAIAWVRTRDWQWGIPVVGVAATWLPWFASADRPIFSFYAVVTIPFIAMALALCAAQLWEWASFHQRRQAIVAVGLSAYVTVTIAVFVFLWPVLTGQLIPYDDWLRRMILPSWI